MRTRVSAGWWAVTIAAMLLGMAMPVIAGDGQIDIAILPYTISEPGSYIVVDNLTLTDLNTPGIYITTSDVTIDLNGHTLTGPGKTAGSSGDGIFAQSGLRNIAIFNGTVRAFRGDGIELMNNVYARIWQINACENGGDGITGLFNGMIFDNSCLENGGDGINASGLIRNNICVANDEDGIDTSGSSVIGNVSKNNLGDGIEAGTSMIDQNLCTGNISSNYNLSSCTSGTNH